MIHKQQCRLLFVSNENDYTNIKTNYYYKMLIQIYTRDNHSQTSNNKNQPHATFSSVIKLKAPDYKSNQLKNSGHQVLISNRKLKQCDSARASFALALMGSIALAILSNTTPSHQLQLHTSNASSSIIIDQQSFSGAQLLPTSQQQQQSHNHPTGQAAVGAHLQPSFVYGARNRSVNFTHIVLDEITSSIYVGATNWLFQLSAANLKAEYALKTGPATENSRDCAPADCLAHIAHIDTSSLLTMHHAHGTDLSIPISPAVMMHSRRPAGSTMHTQPANSSHSSYAFLAPPRSLPITSSTAGRLGSAVTSTTNPTANSAGAATTPQLQQNNNYNKILAIDSDSRQLIVCGSLNQGACRKHQLGQLANYSELIPLPVASNDEHSSSLALVSMGASEASPNSASRHQKPIMYVAATNSRLGPYREMVPAISARYLEPVNRAMQIIEKSFTDSARIDISFELRDYYLVNYVYTFQHNEFIYFATVQRKSPLRQLEEWGYITRLARLCLSDLSFQSYTELTLECRSAGPTKQFSGGRAPSDQQQQVGGTNYNLLQDAYLTNASSHLAQQLGVRSQSSMLVSVFAQSKDHTTRSQQKSAICLYPMEKIEQKFNENIHLCYNGSSKARNMNYIAGSVNDCPKPGKAGNIANFCNEPIKLNGSLPLIATPVLNYDNELLTSIVATQAPTSPININTDHHQQHQQHQHNQQRRHTGQRQHQVLIAGTNDGRLKRIGLVSGDHGFGLKGVEFDSIQVDEQQQEPILADLLLLPSANPQLSDYSQAGSSANVAQFALAITPYKLVKLRINSCKATKSTTKSANLSISMVEDCNACAQLQDPFCGWCASSGSCVNSEECLTATVGQHSTVHWTPFDQIKCADYQPVTPQFVPIQTTSHLPIEVNIRYQPKQLLGSVSSLALQLAQTQFTCHFDYLAMANRSAAMQTLSGATTKATQARLNLHTSTVMIACPLPPQAQRPHIYEPYDQLKTKINVRLVSSHLNGITELSVRQLFGIKQRTSANGSSRQQANTVVDQSANEGTETIERELTLYDCSVHSSCNSCLSAGMLSISTARRWSCSWCPLSNRCTFNSSHPDFGCTASAIISTTPHSAPSPGTNLVRASHLTSSLDQAQATVFGMSIDKLSRCPSSLTDISDDGQLVTTKPEQRQQHHQSQTKSQTDEVLIPNNSRRSIQVNLKQPLGQQQLVAGNKRVKLECLLEVEGAKARINAKLLEGTNQVVVCQENTFTYQEEIAIQHAQLLVILNDNQVIDMTNVILYKCHLFGVSPPALTSTIGATGNAQHSSAAWRAHEFFQFASPALPSTGSQLFKRQATGYSDCSLCLNVERKYQCAWCQNQCQHSDQCTEFQASTCPPPRIDSIHPTSGPLEGGTLLTIEGSNLGSNEREIQDKISVGGEPCQLIMYSVSTRIVCKTGPSLHGPQAATVFVGNRAGVTSAYEKFHYKAVHLTDVNPRIGPVSGGTRLYLTGSNLNIGSRALIFLDEIPCSLDGNNDISNNQITCVTAPNLLATSMRIIKLTLMIDNSTHYLPYPFTYQPDPIITSIEPAESFVSGGRLILITGQHLTSPQSTKLMVYHEQKHNIINATSCITQNDTLITCLTPSLSREMLANLFAINSGGPLADQQQSTSAQDQQQSAVTSLTTYESGGLKLKMSLFMDDVRSVRNLDEYYHHLPHYLTYYEDPQLFRLPSPVVEFADELVIAGENLKMKQLDQDMLITIGSNICTIKSLKAHQVICEPPQKVAPVYDENGRLMDRPLLPIVALIGSNLKYQIGHMQYSSRQYQLLADSSLNSFSGGSSLSASFPSSPLSSSSSPEPSTSSVMSSSSVAILISLSVVGFIIGFVTTLIFALSRFRHSKAEREYKRIQLQMGSLDVNSQPLNGNLFANIHITNNSQTAHSARSRALDYVGGALSGKKFFYQLNQQLPSFPPSPLTDISSLTGSNPISHNQHVVKLSSNGTIINSTAQTHPYNSTNSTSSQSSPGSTRNSGHLVNQNNQNGFVMQQQQQQQLMQSQSSSDKTNLLLSGHQASGNTRNFSWTQEAPSTIVPYAVIEACNLTLEGKNAIKEYV